MMMKSYLHLFTLLSLISVAFYSCNEADRNKELLDRANTIVETEPKSALRILDSISTPDRMDEELYMRYIVTHIQARYKDYQDISSDSLIFVAKKYFKDYPNDIYTPLAHFYAAWTYSESSKYALALIDFWKARDTAMKVKNNLLVGKSHANIGYLYYNQNMMDSSIAHSKQALEYFKNVDNTEYYRLQTITTLGRAYLGINSLDSAYKCFDNTFKLAEQNKNRQFQALSNQNIGVTLRIQGELDQSVKFLHTALNLTKTIEDSAKICLSLSKVYMQKNDLDSSRYYANIIDSRVAETDYLPTKKEIYDVLMKFSERDGNYKEAFRYANLQSNIRVKIMESDVSAKLIHANTQILMHRHDKENASFLNKVYLFGSLCILLALIIGFIQFWKYKKLQQKQELTLNSLKFEKEKQDINENFDERYLKYNERYQRFQDRVKKWQETEKQNREAFEIDIAKAEANKKALLVQSFVSPYRLYNELKNEWSQIENRLNSLSATQHTPSKPQFQEYINGLLQNLKEKADLKLFELAEDCVREIRKGQELILQLEQKELILLVLSCSKYSDEAIGEILDNKPPFIIIERIQLKYKLQEIGISEIGIKELLYPDTKVKKSL